MPYSIVHATQFFEFAKGLADGVTDGDAVVCRREDPAQIVSDDVAAAVGRTAVGSRSTAWWRSRARRRSSSRSSSAWDSPPRTTPARSSLTRRPRTQISLQDATLLPGPDAHIAETRFADWLAQPSVPPGWPLSAGGHLFSSATGHDPGLRVRASDELDPHAPAEPRIRGRQIGHAGTAQHRNTSRAAAYPQCL